MTPFQALKLTEVFQAPQRSHHCLGKKKMDRIYGSIDPILKATTANYFR